MNNERFFVDKVSVSLSVASSLRVLLFYAFGVKPWGTGETKSGKSFFVFRFRFGSLFSAALRKWLAAARANASRKRTLKRLSDVTLGCNAFDLEMHCGESNCGIARLDGRDEIQSWNYGESGNVPSVPGFPPRLSPVFPPVFPIASCPSPSLHKGGNSEHVRNRISRYVFVKNIGAGNVDNGPLAPLSTCWGSERVDQEFPVPQYHGCFFGCCAVCCGCCGVLLFAAKTGQGSPKEPLSPPCPA